MSEVGGALLRGESAGQAAAPAPGCLEGSPVGLAEQALELGKSRWGSALGCRPAGRTPWRRRREVLRGQACLCGCNARGPRVGGLAAHRPFRFRCKPSGGGSLAAIDRIAAQRDGCCASCSSTIRTARSRSSGESLFVVLPVIPPASQELEAPTNPGRFRDHNRPELFPQQCPTLHRWGRLGVGETPTGGTTMKKPLPSTVGVWFNPWHT
jgi:hypothetical protein